MGLAALTRPALLQAAPRLCSRQAATGYERRPAGHNAARCATGSSAAAMEPLISTKTFFLDAFALRQWDDPNFAGTRLQHNKGDFVQRVQQAYDSGARLVEGYAPFCKHIFLPADFLSPRPTVGALPVTPENEHLLRSGYTRRRPEELAVLTRWFPADKVQATEARFLDVILYSREQLLKELAALPYSEGNPELPDAPWGIISIKAQDEDYETPMAPITMLRNALGREEGGSGVPLDRSKYDASVAYWESHAAIQ